MPTMQLPLVSMLLSLASAQVFSPSGLTLRFTPNGSSDACPGYKNETTAPEVQFHLDSSQLPAASLCVNLRDMFSQNTTIQTGSVNNDALFREPNLANERPQPVHASANWTSYGGNRFQPGANYTNVWYYQQNATGTIGGGQFAALDVTLWPFENCSYETPGFEAYTYNCQSGEAGRCSQDLHGIRSVGFFVVNQSAAGTCHEFQEYPSDGNREYGGAGWFAIAAGLMLSAGLVM